MQLPSMARSTGLKTLGSCQYAMAWDGRSLGRGDLTSPEPIQAGVWGILQAQVQVSLESVQGAQVPVGVAL